MPELPDILKQKEYKPSGKFSSSAPLVILLISFIFGLVFGGAGFVLGGLAATALSLVALNLGIEILAAPFFFVGYLFALVASGVSTGMLIWLSAKLAKCRKPGLTGGLGFLGVFLGYLSFIMILPNYASKEMAELSTSISVIFGIAFVLVSAGYAMIKNEKASYCESSGRWHSKNAFEAAMFNIDFAKPLIDSLSAEKFENLSNSAKEYFIGTGTKSFAKYGHSFLEVELVQCPYCNECDARLSAIAKWEDSNQNNKDEECFKVLLNNETARKIKFAIFENI